MPATSDLQQIPGVGPRMAEGFESVGVHRVADLRGADPEDLYRRMCERHGEKLDRCVLYVVRCAVYYASTKRHRPELLRWWAWKDSQDGKCPSPRKHPVRMRAKRLSL